MADDTEAMFRRINQELDKRKRPIFQGLYAGGLIIQRQAQKWVPVEYGKLRASAYTRRSQDDEDAVEVGFSAAYAVYVHENMEQKLKGQPRPSGLGKYWGPNGRPRFLAEAARAKRKEVLDTIAKYAKKV